MRVPFLLSDLANRPPFDRHRVIVNAIKRWFHPARARQLDEKLASAARKKAIARVDYPRAKIRIHVTSEMERRWRTTACAKEPWTVAWLDTQIQPGDVLYDLGANVGVFSLIGASRLKGRGTVVAFEPGYASYARLCENIVLNGFEERIIPVPLPMSSRTGLQAFTYRTIDPGQSRHTFAGDAWKAEGSQTTRGHYSQPMLAMTLDAAVPLFGLPAPTLVKLDVDGAELHVLEGAQKTFAAEQVRSLVIEIENELTEPVTALLARLGFRLIDRPDRKRAAKAWYGIFGR